MQVCAGVCSERCVSMVCNCSGLWVLIRLIIPSAVTAIGIIVLIATTAYCLLPTAYLPSAVTAIGIVVLIATAAVISIAETAVTVGPSGDVRPCSRLCWLWLWLWIDWVGSGWAGLHWLHFTRLSLVWSGWV